MNKCKRNPSENQVNLKSLIPLAPKFIKCPGSYRVALSKTEKKILDIIVKIRKNGTKIRNGYIATLANCSIRTIQRATAKFQRDGIISKEQDNTYAPNRYYNNIPRHISQTLWLNSQTKEQQTLYTTHGIIKRHDGSIKFYIPEPIKENVIQLNSYINYIPFLQTLTPLVKQVKSLNLSKIEPVAHNYQNYQNHKGNNLIKELSSQFKGNMLTDTQRKWIFKADEMKDPRLKDIVCGVSVQSQLITPIVESVAKLLELDLKDQLKVAIYPDKALEFAYKEAQDIISGEIVYTKQIHDRTGWFLGIAKKFCTDNHLSADWPLFYQICKIMDIDANEKHIPKPLKINHKKGNRSLTPPLKTYIKTHSNKKQNQTSNPSGSEISPEEHALYIKSINGLEEQIKHIEKYLKNPFLWHKLEEAKKQIEEEFKFPMPSDDVLYRSAARTQPVMIKELADKKVELVELVEKLKNTPIETDTIADVDIDIDEIGMHIDFDTFS
jgi:hypothetical protein